MGIILHTDNDGKDVVLHIETDARGKEIRRHVTYKENGIQYRFLTGMEASALILLGIPLSQCYIPELTKNHFIKAKDILFQPLSCNRLVAHLRKSHGYLNGMGEEEVRGYIDRAISAVEVVEGVVSDHEPRDDDATPELSLVDPVELWINEQRFRKTKINCNIDIAECIVGRLDLSLITIRGYVQLNKDKERVSQPVRAFASNENIEWEAVGPTSEPSVLFDVDLAWLNIEHSLSLYNCFVTVDKKRGNAGSCTLRNLHVKNDLFFSHAKLCAPGDFRNLKVGGVLEVGNTSFHMTADFGEVEVGLKASFSLTRFLAKPGPHLPRLRNAAGSFDNAAFAADVDFSLAEFAWETLFEGASFGGKVRFDNTKFEDKAQFNNVEFKNSASFTGASFRNGAAFIRAVFCAQADFRNAEFFRPGFYYGTDLAHFDQMGRLINEAVARWVFQGAADFTDAVFRDRTIFSGVTFNNDACFDGAEFSGRTYFFTTTFLERGLFRSCVFHDVSEFTYPTFVYASFRNARFEKSCDMRNTTACMLDFSGSVFGERLLFSALQENFEDRLDRIVETLESHKIWLQDALSELQETEEQEKDLAAKQKQDIIEGMALRQVEEYLLQVKICKDIQQSLLSVDFEDTLVQGELRCDFSHLTPRHGMSVLKWNYGYVSEQAQKQYTWLKEQYRKQGAYEDEDKAHWWASEFARLRSDAVAGWWISEPTSTVRVGSRLRHIPSALRYQLLVPVSITVLALLLAKDSALFLIRSSKFLEYIIPLLVTSVVFSLVLWFRHKLCPRAKALGSGGWRHLPSAMLNGLAFLSPAILAGLAVGHEIVFGALVPVLLGSLLAGCLILPRFGKFFLYRKVFGYGVRPRNILLTICVVVIVCCAAFAVADCSGHLKPHPSELQPSAFDNCVLKGLYFSVITFATVGYGDVRAVGWAAGLAMTEGLLGIVLNAALIVVVFRKLIR